jgi:hypothetical protein
MNLDQFKGYIPPAVDQYIFQLESENQRLHNELMKVISSNAGWMNEAKELEAEKKEAIKELKEMALLDYFYYEVCWHIIKNIYGEQEAGDD